MKTGPALKTLGLAALLLLAAVGSAAILPSGCGADETVGDATLTADKMEASVVALPLLDQEAPEDFQTATFAFG